MKIYDRLYKEIKFPSIIMDLLNCPGLLRLRDVRMANNQFVAFPSFSTTSRYEHSLGVCYLAGVCAQNMRLDEKDTLELMIACLYHDVGTPPFAHAMEEVLQAKFGFDHEQNLKELIMGTSGSFDGELAQIFQGQGLKLLSVCQGKRARKIGLSVHRIAKLAAGDSDDFLAPLVNSNGMDLDNIDNIFRASSAMGIIEGECGEIAKMLANSFVINNGKICSDGLYAKQLQQWQRTRDMQYSAIFDSIEDFAYQTMIKKAINFLLEDDENAENLDIAAWRLTDSEITYNYLLKHNKSREIMKRVLLCKPFTCLGVFYIEGEGVCGFINAHIEEIEKEIGEYYKELIGKKNGKNLSEDSYFHDHPVIANFYPDKRKRSITNTVYLWDNESEEQHEMKKMQGALLGLFTPFGNSYYKEIEVEGKRERRNVSIRKQDIEEIGVVLKKGVLTEFRISLYGSEKNGKNDTDLEANQLGFF